MFELLMAADVFYSWIETGRMGELSFFEFLRLCIWSFEWNFLFFSESPAAPPTELYRNLSCIFPANFGLPLLEIPLYPDCLPRLLLIIVTCIAWLSIEFATSSTLFGVLWVLLFSSILPISGFSELIFKPSNLTERCLVGSWVVLATAIC